MPEDARRPGVPHGTEPAMSMAYLAQPDQQQHIEWLQGSTLAMLLDGQATDGQLMMGRFAASEGEASPYHLHTLEDEIFLLIKGTALVCYDDQEYELEEGGVVYLPRDKPHSYRITSKQADLLFINTPAGIEGMFRKIGRDMGTPRPEGFEVKPDAAVVEEYGGRIVGPPR
jgi:quercetin dioxygenase-like cupin family protein